MAATGARRNWLVWLAVVPVALWALVRLLGFGHGFPLEAMMAFTPWIAVLALLVTGIAVAAENWAAAALVDRLHPDVLSVEELTPKFARRLRAAGLEERLPQTVLETRRSASGAGLYSNLPLRKLPAPARFGFRMPRARLQLPDGRAVRVVGVHPYPPQGRDSTAAWEESLASLPSAGAGLVPTFPRAFHTIPPITIDHVLADRRLGIVEYAVEEVPGSDHRAVFAVLRLP